MAIQSPKSFIRERRVGEYDILLPEPPPISEIANHDLPQKEQKFYPPNDVVRFHSMSTEDQYKLIEREWSRRVNGYWFYNNGKIEYITGIHYFYLAHWKIDIGLPKFVDADRDYFYLWDKCYKDDDCYGLIYIANRREGKTYKATATLYEKISRTLEANGGIQSKTGPDAKKVFRKLVRSWKKLPDFFKPVDSGDTSPTTSLKFEEPSHRNLKGQKKTYRKVLNSEIDYESAKEESYDGLKLLMYVGDEVGKTVDANVYERWMIVKECLVVGQRIVGKALLTTTVEEMEKKGGMNCKLIWEDSDPENLDGTGRTISGLRRYFKPAYYGLEGFVDEYGISQVDEAKDYLERRRQGKSGNSLLSEKRKYPFLIDEAFIIQGGDSPFDINKCNDQISFNDDANIMPVRGNFIWQDGERDSSVLWKPDENGKWYVTWHPNADERNRVQNFENNRKPVPSGIVAGLDPFDHKMTTDKRMSNAACYAFRKSNPMDPQNSNMFISQYLCRPESPNILYEDMIKQCVYYGHLLLVENNKPGVINYFRQRGYEGYLMTRPAQTHTKFSLANQREVGIPLTGEAARDVLIEHLTAYIYEFIGYHDDSMKIGRCDFRDLLRDWIEFDPSKWTKYDAVVASGLAIIASKVKEYEYKAPDIRNFLVKYDQSGIRSRRIE